MRQSCVRLLCRRCHPAVRLRGAGADRRAHAPAARRLGDANRLRLRRRHLDRAEDRRRRRPSQLAARRRDLPALLAGRQDDRLHGQLRRQHRRLHRPDDGGEPVRLTYHPMDDRVVDWHPDGKRVLFASSRESGRQRYSQFYLVAAKGGLPEKLPVPYGEFAAFSPDGTERRLPAAVAGVPHLEALSRRLGAGHLAVRPQDSRRRTSRRTTPTTSPDVARHDALLPVRSRRQAARQHLGARQGDRRGAAGHAVHRLRRDVPRHRPRRHRLPGRRAAVSPGPASREGERGRDPGGDGSARRSSRGPRTSRR